MPSVDAGKGSTPEEQLAKRRANARDKAQIQTVRTEHKVPDEQRVCPKCGNDKLKPIGKGRRSVVFEFVPARFVRHEHVQEVLRCRCGDYVVAAPGARPRSSRKAAMAPPSSRTWRSQSVPTICQSTASRRTSSAKASNSPAQP